MLAHRDGAKVEMGALIEGGMWMLSCYQSFSLLFSGESGSLLRTFFRLINDYLEGFCVCEISGDAYYISAKRKQCFQGRLQKRDLDW